VQEVGARETAMLEVLRHRALATGLHVENRHVAERRAFQDHDLPAVRRPVRTQPGVTQECDVLGKIVQRRSVERALLGVDRHAVRSRLLLRGRGARKRQDGDGEGTQ